MNAPNTPPREGTLPVGTMLYHGRYRVERFLAAGGFGNTYLARDVQFDELVAIKEFFLASMCGRGDGSNDVVISLVTKQKEFEAHREKMRKEAKRLRALQHPNIVKVRDLFDENGTTYYVMDFIPGQSLRSKLKQQHRPFAETEVMQKILPQLLDALETVHAEGIWHLDLNPANMMVDDQGKVVLIDFGASKQLHSVEGQSLSTSSVVAYTQGYAPAEQLNGKLEKFGPWTDLYALGGTLYNLLTNQNPPDYSEIIDNANLFEEHMPSVSAPTIQLIKWLMSQGINHRPKSVAEVRGFLKSSASGGSAAKKGATQSASSVHAASSLQDDSGKTILKKCETKATEVKPQKKPSSVSVPKSVGRRKKLWMGVICGVVALLVGWGVYAYSRQNKNVDTPEPTPNEVKLDANLTPQQKTEIDGLLSNMVKVEGGTFTMGATSEQGSDAYDDKKPTHGVKYDDEKPTHSVTLSSFYLCKYEVTQALWQAVMGNNPSRFKGNNLPVELVSWDDCQTFISRLNNLTGRKFRLPTEAEWEYAARGGNRSRGYKYSGSKNLSDVAWYSGNSGGRTHPVGTKSPNELGLYDMLGNVSEWCPDWKGTYSSSASTKSKKPSGGSYHYHGCRGGSWYSTAWYCRSSCRISGVVGACDNLGLRLALSQL